MFCIRGLKSTVARLCSDLFALKLKPAGLINLTINLFILSDNFGFKSFKRISRFGIKVEYTIELAIVNKINWLPKKRLTGINFYEYGNELILLLDYSSKHSPIIIKSISSIPDLQLGIPT